MRTTLHPARINGDAQQQIVPFFKYFEPTASAFSNDYIADYYLACYPAGYFGLYAGAARLGVDPTLVSRYLPHALWFVAILLLGAAANRLGGKLAAFCAMAFALGSNIYLFRIGGGLPRSFGFPILAATLFSLVAGRAGWCAVCVALGALFYPVAAVISGLSLAGMVLLADVVGSSARSWSWVRRIGFLTFAAVLAAGLILPSAISSRRFGRLVTEERLREFPEAGPGGRYDRDSRPPFRGFFASVPEAVDEALLSGGGVSRTARAWLRQGRRHTPTYQTLKDGLLILVLIGGMGLLLRRPAARRASLLFVASGIGYTLARFAAPYAYLPERYVGYTVPLLTAFALSTSVVGLFPPSFDRRPRRLVKTGALAVTVFVLLFVLGSHVSPKVGTTVNLQKNKVMFQAIAKLPPDVLVAGWPRGPTESVPYAARRRALLTMEVHQAFHDDYLLEMRRRMRAIIDAYFATSPEPIVRLRDELGVTHLLINRHHFGGRPPTYFRPFNGWIFDQRARARGKPFELSKELGDAVVVSHEHLVLLDLSRIGAGAAATGPPRPPSAGSRIRRKQK
jgi:hypothetical protein